MARRWVSTTGRVLPKRLQHFCCFIEQVGTISCGFIACGGPSFSKRTSSRLLSVRILVPVSKIAK
jgi:hypothetical protein